MTRFTEKRFTVSPPDRVQPRDCATHGHWPRHTKDGYRCYWCNQRCTVDGRDRTDAPAEREA